MNIKERLAKLEKSYPKINPLKDLTDEELEHKAFLLCQKASDEGIDWDMTNVVLNFPKCRQFAKSEPWLDDRNHRLDVFLGFIQRTINQSLPNQEKVNYILGLGWRGLEIPADDIKWLVSELQGFDLGDEGPWLLGYLEHSGKD